METKRKDRNLITMDNNLKNNIVDNKYYLEDRNQFKNYKLRLFNLNEN